MDGRAHGTGTAAAASLSGYVRSTQREEETMTDLAKYGPWAVIAGGSEGVGAEFARMLAEDGFNLVLIARKDGPLQDTAQRCRDLGVEVRALSLDLLEPHAVSRAVEATSDIEVGLLIYNAGAST